MFQWIDSLRRVINLRKVKKQTSRSNMDTEFIANALSTIPGYRKRGKAQWQRIVLDNKYWTCSKEDFQKIVEFNKINEKQYIADKFDCDNFSFNFKAQVATNHNLNNVGIVIDNSGGHAYNVVIFNDGTADLFEPQTDQWIIPGSDKLYSFKRGIIIL